MPYQTMSAGYQDFNLSSFEIDELDDDEAFDGLLGVDFDVENDSQVLNQCSILEKNLQDYRDFAFEELFDKIDEDIEPLEFNLNPPSYEDYKKDEDYKKESPASTPSRSDHSIRSMVSSPAASVADEFDIDKSPICFDLAMPLQPPSNSKSEHPATNSPHIDEFSVDCTDLFDPSDTSNFCKPVNPTSILKLPIKREEISKKKCNPSKDVSSDEKIKKLQSTPGIEDGTPILSLLDPSDKLLVSEFTNAVVNEMQVTSFSRRDRKGKRSCFPNGYLGMSCRHCDGKIGRTGRYFPSSVKTISDSKKSLYAMHRHMAGCVKCPDEVKHKMDSLFKAHAEKRKVNKRQGTQRAYFRKIWTALHPIEPALPDSK